MSYLSQRTYQRQALSQTQRQSLKLALRLSQELKHPDIPAATTGYEGMVVADDILKERYSVGLLIGGIAQNIWSQRTKKEYLSEKKDVDVVVFNDDFSLDKPFEGGIDWWLPQEARVGAYSSVGLSKIEMHQKWWENGFQCVLNWGFHESENASNDYPDLKPGLYIPTRSDVIQMKILYALSFVNNTMDLDGDWTELENLVEKKFSKEIGTRLPKFIRDRFEGQILDPYYEDDWKKTHKFTPTEIDRDILLKIKSTA